jgi:osmotically-inducible protein OsmY
MRLVLIGISVLFIAGCMDVATTGAQVVYHHHSIQKNLSDQYITLQAYQDLYHHSKQFKNAHISITTFNQEVLLAGETPSAWQKQQAQKLIKKIPDIKAIYNLITVSEVSSSLTRMSDAWLTAKVKAKLITEEELDASQIKVVSENGSVYLMGILTKAQAHLAAQLASETDGVQQVFTLFSYMHISKR